LLAIRTHCCWSLQFIAEEWQRFLPSSTKQDLLAGSYYSVLVQPKLRVISFNSIYCDIKNLYAVLNQTDLSNQFTWLNNTLEAARAAGEKVYIIGHMVPTGMFAFPHGASSLLQTTSTGARVNTLPVLSRIAMSFRHISTETGIRMVSLCILPLNFE
jgi:hypothetical protein